MGKIENSLRLKEKEINVISIACALLLNFIFFSCSVESSPTRVMIKVSNAKLPMKILFYENSNSMPSVCSTAKAEPDTFTMLDSDSIVCFLYDYSEADFPGLYVENETQSDSEALSRILVVTRFHDYNYLELPILKRPSVDISENSFEINTYYPFICAGLAEESGYYVWNGFSYLPQFVFLGKRVKLASFYEEKNDDNEIILSCRSAPVEMDIPMDNHENIAKGIPVELKLTLGTEFTNELTDEKFEEGMDYVYGNQPQEIRIDLGQSYDSIDAVIIYDIHSRYYYPAYALVEDTSQFEEMKDTFDIYAESYHVLWFGGKKGRYFILKSNYHNIESLREIAIIKKK